MYLAASLAMAEGCTSIAELQGSCKEIKVRVVVRAFASRPCAAEEREQSLGMRGQRFPKMFS